MENKQTLISGLQFIESTIKSTGKLIDFYIDYAPHDEHLQQSLQNLMSGCGLLIPTFPQIVTGNMQGMNIKKDVINNLQEAQVAIYYSDIHPEKFRKAWQEFIFSWTLYHEILSELLEKNSYIYLSLN